MELSATRGTSEFLLGKVKTMGFLYGKYLVAHPTNRKWVIYNPSDLHGISRVNPLITGVITHLLSGMSHQVWN